MLEKTRKRRQTVKTVPLVTENFEHQKTAKTVQLGIGRYWLLQIEQRMRRLLSHLVPETLTRFLVARQQRNLALLRPLTIVCSKWQPNLWMQPLKLVCWKRPLNLLTQKPRRFVLKTPRTTPIFGYRLRWHSCLRMNFYRESIELLSRLLFSRHCLSRHQ